MTTDGKQMEIIIIIAGAVFSHNAESKEAGGVALKNTIQLI